MIPTNGFVIQHERGGLLMATPGSFTLIWEPFGGGRWTRANAESLLTMLPALGVPVDGLSVQPAPACGCCGEWRRHLISTVRDADDGEAIRCEAHAGRLPCMIEGCGRTFKMAPDDRYGWRIICGRHWRMAPKRMRDAVARVRRIAKRRGWTMAMHRRHERLWSRTARAVLQRGDVGGEGHIDIAEIEAMFGLVD